MGDTEVDLYSWRRRWDELDGDVRRFRDWGGGDGGGVKSDRTLKRDVLPVRWSNASEQANPTLDDGSGLDGFALLQALESLPTSTWRYDWEDPQIRHLGPMAQDWYEKFGLGNDNTTIATVDVAGVLITAIQALTQKVHRLEREVSRLKNK
ncbi:tail fiber domain-containing protein [Parafrankia sp. Ea1.12]|uniref:tail fiber domain-containing protein n=1 Tax=Parafrankia sp. Ea1.12 TaxID=573499 RepID=UPI00135681A3|nr:tail fiber domain-containing protein [Parafrankia sp. Ea1.12]